MIFNTKRFVMLGVVSVLLLFLLLIFANFLFSYNMSIDINNINNIQNIQNIDNIDNINDSIYLTNSNINKVTITDQVSISVIRKSFIGKIYEYPDKGTSMLIISKYIQIPLKIFNFNLFYVYISIILILIILTVLFCLL